MNVVYWWVGWNIYISLSTPTLEPIRTVTSFNAPTTSTKRIPSAFEATEPRERRCGQCRLPGPTRNSLQCTHSVRRLNQEFEIDRVAQSSTTTMALDFSDSEDSHINPQPPLTIQVAVESVKSRANTSNSENTIEVDTRPIGQAAQSLFTRLI
jgi:hypothetical protein